MKLNPEDLNVTSFSTAEAGAPSPQDPSIIIISPNDPTAATWCFICPAETERCW